MMKLPGETLRAVGDRAGATWEVGGVCWLNCSACSRVHPASAPHLERDDRRALWYWVGAIPYLARPVAVPSALRSAAHRMGERSQGIAPGRR